MLHQFKIRLFTILLLCVFALGACGAREETVAQGTPTLQEASPSKSQTESTSEFATEHISESAREIPSESETTVTSEPPEISENLINMNAGINEEESAHLYITLRNSNYTITNAEGETLTITDGLVGGTMPILQRTFFGEASVTLRFKVPFSESFTFTCDNSDADNYYLVSWGEQFASADGTGMEAVMITQSNVQLTGDNMDYLVRYSFGPEASNKVYLSGSDETFVTFEQTEEGFQVSTQNDALLEIKDLETQTVVFSESVAANITYSLNYHVTDSGVVVLENPEQED